jgi:hypothetical protein
VTEVMWTSRLGSTLRVQQGELQLVRGAHAICVGVCCSRTSRTGAGYTEVSRRSWGDYMDLAQEKTLLWTRRGNGWLMRSKGAAVARCRDVDW